MAYGAEVGSLVGVHTAILCRAVHTFGLVASTFVDTYFGVSVLSISYRRYFGALGEHVLPFAPEVGKRGQILFPWLYAGWVHGHVLVVVEVFVRQSGKGMPELMHYY